MLRRMSGIYVPEEVANRPEMVLHCHNDEEHQSHQKDCQDFLRLHYTILSEYYLAASVSTQSTLNICMTAISIVAILTTILLPISYDASTSLFIAVVLDALLFIIGAYIFLQFLFARDRASFYSARMDRLAAYLAYEQEGELQHKDLIYYVNEELYYQLSLKRSNLPEQKEGLFKFIQKKFGFDDTHMLDFFFGNVMKEWPDWQIWTIALLNSITLTILLGLTLLGWEGIQMGKGGKVPAFDTFLQGLYALHSGFLAFIAATITFLVTWWLQIAWEAHARKHRNDRVERILGGIIPQKEELEQNTTANNSVLSPLPSGSADGNLTSPVSLA